MCSAKGAARESRAIDAYGSPARCASGAPCVHPSQRNVAGAHDRGPESTRMRGALGPDGHGGVRAAWSEAPGEVGRRRVVALGEDAGDGEDGVFVGEPALPLHRGGLRAVELSRTERALRGVDIAKLEVTGITGGHAVSSRRPRRLQVQHPSIRRSTGPGTTGQRIAAPRARLPHVPAPARCSRAARPCPRERVARLLPLATGQAPRFNPHRVCPPVRRRARRTGPPRARPACGWECARGEGRRPPPAPGRSYSRGCGAFSSRTRGHRGSREVGTLRGDRVQVVPARRSPALGSPEPRERAERRFVHGAGHGV